MNDQNETAQLRFLEETAIQLRQNGFTVEPIEDHHLPVCWEKGRLCRISDKGSVLYRQERVDALGAQDALQAVIDTAKMASKYMAILETAPMLSPQKPDMLSVSSRNGVLFSGSFPNSKDTERRLQTPAHSAPCRSENARRV